MNLGVLTAFLSSSNQTSQRPFQRIPSVDGLVACMVKRIDVSIQSLFYAVILIIFQKVGNKSLRVLQGDYFFLLGLKFSRIKKEYPIGFVYRMGGSLLHWENISPFSCFLNNARKIPMTVFCHQPLVRFPRIIRCPPDISFVCDLLSVKRRNSHSLWW